MRTMNAAMVVLALASTGWAADGPGDRPGRGKPADRMAAWLDLTPDQSEKLKALMTQHRKATRDLRDKRQDAMRALRYLVEDKGTDAQITAKLNELKTAQDALQAAQKRQRDDMAKVLTPTQQAKFVTGAGKRAMQRMKGGPGGRRGEGPGDDHGRQARHDDDDEEDDD